MQELDSVIVRFAGDSGDGMQLAGTQFSNTSAIMGNDISTFPDFPAEIRAPRGTEAGVSGFQVHIGAKEIHTPGDAPYILVAMNPAAFKVNLKDLEQGGILIANTDEFTDKNLEKLDMTGTVLDSPMVEPYKVVRAAITSQTVEALKELDLDNKSKERCKNFYALGLIYYMLHREIDPTLKWIREKFAGKDTLIQANETALKAGFNFGDTIEESVSRFKIPAAKIQPGTYKQINGNTATAWGFIQAAQTSGRELFLGSYPITPASDILHELSKRKDFNVKTFQAEDEIAGICTSIGAAFSGALAITSTSGPGMALKGEAMGLAMMYELPLVIINVQRGGPSTGLPTKTEQSDLMQAFYGRNGESPVAIVAASRPADCFHMAYEASRLALEHMTPVILLTDGYIANGAEPWRLPDLDKDYSTINTTVVKDGDYNDKEFLAYERNAETYARPWALPGTPGLEHRLGGLEKKSGTGNISYDPANHEAMCFERRDKILKMQNSIPELELEGEDSGDVLVVSWGGTYGAVTQAVSKLQKEGKKISLAHLRYINPFPKNFESTLKNFKKILVPELNLGQLVNIMNAEFRCDAHGINKVQGLPFKISELVEAFNKELN
ncbi:2-oxoacid:acceptor oxidoreductase subunit alpha [Bacteriovoracaceae bacterium]|nr:2-oxoacid:acceptor oxidoreductase subunit alpha [Bacteriovoracaceae bacterium]